MIKPKPLDDISEYLEPGTTLQNGQYTIVHFLNVGGFGITYLAKDSLDRDVVIKECYPGALCRREQSTVGVRSRAYENQFAKSINLFLREAQNLAKLRHPNIVGVHQVFQDNQTAYMALDYIEGFELLDYINDKKAKKNIPFIVSLVQKILKAIKYMHQNDILHRDISPDNILIGKDGAPILIDFGAARVEAINTNRVLSTLSVVKDGYSPQEFYLAGSHQNPSSDLYAFGASVYHYISSELPPNSQLRLAARAESKPDPYVPLSGRFDGYPRNFLAAIDKSLNLIPKERFQNATEWLDAINPDTNTTIDSLQTLRAVIRTDIDEPDSHKKQISLSVAAVLVLAFAGVVAMRPEMINWRGPATTPPPVQKLHKTDTAIQPPPDPIAAAKRAADQEAARVAAGQKATKLVAEKEAARAAAKQQAARIAAREKAAKIVAEQEAVRILAEKRKQLAQAFQVTQDHWKFSLPFGWKYRSFGNTRFLAVTGAAPDNPVSAFFERGDTIYKVNGTRILQKGTMDTILNQLQSNSTSGDISVDILFKKKAASQYQTKTVPLLAEKRITLSNGIELELRKRNKTWQALIKNSPFTDQNALLSGDIILAENIDNNTFDTPDKVEAFLTNVGKGSYTSLPLTVLRDGQIVKINIEQ